MDVSRAGSETPRSLSSVVADLYRHIDERDVSAAMSCFAKHAVYRRPGYAAFVGLSAIGEFYQGGRMISTGQHDIEAILEGVDTVAVRGTFHGASHDGVPLAARFADFWRFSGLEVVERETYFDAAAV